MKMLNRVLILDDGHRMYTYFFIPDSKLKAIVQIVHGLGEHAGRYSEFASKLTDAGFLVCADDHRGFGRSTVSKDQIGHISDKDGYKLIIEDLKYLMTNTKADYPNIPYFMFGHSMGSFLTRGFLIKYHKDLDGAVIMGTRGKPKGIENLGKTIANIQKSIFGGRKRAYLLDKLSVGGYGKKYFPEDNSHHAWLTSDKKEINKVLEDFDSGSHSKNIVSKALNNYNLKYNSNLTLEQFSLAISNYSGTKDEHGNIIFEETIAEGVHDYYLHGTNCKKESYEIIQVIKNKLQGEI